MKDNFQWVCRNGILTTELIERYRKEFCDNDIYISIRVQIMDFCFAPTAMQKRMAIPL